jgi:aconitate hydratase
MTPHAYLHWLISPACGTSWRNSVGDPESMNSLIPAVLTIDHSVIVERYAEADAVEQNLKIDFGRNSERYRFIKWAQKSLTNFGVIPPGAGIIH